MTTESQKNETITTYKGFDKNLACTGGSTPFQYEIGKTYEHDGEVAACSSGFHACENPLDVFTYYRVAASRFALVEQTGDLARHSGDSKLASRKITIKAELNLAGIIKAGIKYTQDLIKKPTSGDYAHAATSGKYAHAATSGYCAHAATSGDSAHAATSGDYANAATSGNCAHAATSGDSAHAATSGKYAHAATSGKYANAATSGDYAHAATSGNCAHAATSGDYAHAATSGDYAHAATSGDYANAATSGYSANVQTKAKNAVAANAGNGKARAGAGGAIFIVERDDELNILAVFASKVGENGIEPDCWYLLRDGKPVKVEE